MNVKLLVSTEFAGFWRRFAAALIDLTILAAGILIILIISHLLQLQSILSYEITSSSINILGTLLPWFYYIGMEGSSRQATIGKWLMGIKITDLNLRKISKEKALWRNFCKLISTFILFIGFFMAGLTKKKQALHDILADCLVIMEENTKKGLKSRRSYLISSFVVVFMIWLLLKEAIFFLGRFIHFKFQIGF